MKDPDGYSASRATGAPDVPRFGDNDNAWCPKEADAGIDRLEVGFGKPVHATGICIRQSSAPGALIKIELIDDAGKAHAIHEGVDTASCDPYNFWFTRSFAKTPYTVVGARLTLAGNAVSGWNQIDAVQLLCE